MSWVARWRLALRIARRDALRHRGRSLLVITMVGLPVLAVVAATTLLRTNDVTPVEALPGTVGSADARIVGQARQPIHVDPATGASWGDPGEPATPAWSASEIRAQLPAGSTVRQAAEGRLLYRTEHGYAQVLGIADDLGDPLRAGASEVLAGRLPAATGEVAVSPEIAGRGVAVGDEIAVTRDDVPMEVVGVLRVHRAEGAALLALPRSAADLLTEPRVEFFADVPGGLGWPAVRALNEQGLAVVSADVVRDPPPESAWLPPGIPAADGSSGGSAGGAGRAVLALIVVSVVLEVVLLAGPAFAVGVRRQKRDLALLAAAGGQPADLRRVVLAGGVVLGAGAAVAGAVLGVALARLAVPVIEGAFDRMLGPFDVPVDQVLLTAAVGVVAALGAAYVPARQAARTDVVETLAGRRGQVRTSWRSPVLGLLLAGAGLALVVVGAQGTELGVAGGAVLLVLGVVVAAPWLVGLLAPLAGHLPVGGRLAVRDATRNRGRTAPAVAAVMATVAGVTALGIGSASDSAQSSRDYQPQAPMGTALVMAGGETDLVADLERVAAAQVPGREVHRIRTPASTGSGDVALEPRAGDCAGPIGECMWWPDVPVQVTVGGAVTVMDPDAARALYPAALADGVGDALDAGRAVVVGSGVVDGGVLVLSAVRYDPAASAPEETAVVALPAVEFALPPDTASLPAFLVVPTALADRLPVEMVPTTLVIGGPADPVTPEQERELSEAAAALSPSTWVYVERGWSDGLAAARLVLFVLGAVLVLVATLTATGLALTDARPDFATLAAVGAAPRTRRRVAMGAAAVVGGLGSLAGLVVGLAPGIAVAYPLTSEDYGSGAEPVVDIPWALLAGVGVGVPLLAVLVTALAVRTRLPMVRRLA